jgi:hypothetical protein
MMAIADFMTGIAPPNVPAVQGCVPRAERETRVADDGTRFELEERFVNADVPPSKNDDKQRADCCGNRTDPAHHRSGCWPIHHVPSEPPNLLLSPALPDVENDAVTDIGRMGS